MSLEPAIALLAGLLVLGQIPSAAAAVGVLFVVIAGIGVTRTGARTPQPHDHRDATPAPNELPTCRRARVMVLAPGCNPW